MSAELVETNENDLIVGTLRANQNILIVLLSLSLGHFQANKLFISACPVYASVCVVICSCAIVE